MAGSIRLLGGMSAYKGFVAQIGLSAAMAEHG